MDPISSAIEVAGTAAGVAEAAGTVAAAATEAAQVAGEAAKTVEVVGKITQGVSEASKVAEAFPNPVAAEEISKMASGAAESTDVLAGRKAIEDLTQLSDNLGIPKEIPVDVLTEQSVKFTQAQEATTHIKTESALQRWDQENPKPDPKTNPEGYKKWCEDREVAEIDYITEAKTELAMKDWENKNPEPDKTKEPEKHKEWMDKRSKLENSLKERIRKETQNLKANEKAAVITEINRLRELYSVRIDIVEAIKALKRKESPSDEDKITLGKLQDRKSSIDSEINNIETDLKLKQSIAGPLVALIIATALISMQVYKIGQQEGAL